MILLVFNFVVLTIINEKNYILWWQNLEHDIHSQPVLLPGIATVVDIVHQEICYVQLLLEMDGWVTLILVNSD